MSREVQHISVDRHEMSPDFRRRSLIGNRLLLIFDRALLIGTGRRVISGELC
jgi:hypothetical protein